MIKNYHLKNYPVPEPASLLALMLTATGVQQFPQLRSSFEYCENFQKQNSAVTSYMVSNQMAEVAEHRLSDNPSFTKSDEEGFSWFTQANTN